MTRGRRDRLAGALRHFGLVDRFDLGALLAGDALPTEAALARRINRFSETLPDGITAAYLARFIFDELARGEDTLVAATRTSPLTAADGDALVAMPTGTKDAGRYHDLIFRILTGVFYGRLVDAKKEVKQFGGRKRIDITFRNADQTGFFAELVERHEVKAPRIVIECKNYSSDPDNPEFDQLSGRLNPRVGMFGILVVRSIEDPRRMDAHRLDRRAKQEWIVVLDDDDIRAMLDAHLRGDTGAVDERLRERFEPLIFD